MIKAITFFILLPLLLLISILPFPVIYLLSDGLYILVYRLIGYRKKVVFQNLRNAFPDKTEQEIQQIAAKFYHFLCDYIVENIKSITMTRSQVLERVRFEDDSLIKRLVAENKSAIGVLGHYGNWEWAAPAFSLTQEFQLFVIYKRLSNPYFDKLMYSSRSKFGTKLIESNDVVKEMFKHRGTLSTTIFVGDQTPFPDEAHWMKFMNQDTPVFRGTEVIAKKFNLPVVWVTVERVKRGYYVIKTEMLCESPKMTKEGEITELHTNRLAKDIQLHPELWLWSHRRWKHRRNN